MLVALLAIVVGATILSGLVTIYLDVPRQMGAQFRNYGANMILLPAAGKEHFSLEEVNQALKVVKEGELVGVSPYRYESVLIHEQPVEAAGTDLIGAKATSPYWYIDGEWPEKENEILVGKEKAQLLGLSPGDSVQITYSLVPNQIVNEEQAEASETEASMDLLVSGILETGGSEEGYIYLWLQTLETLTGEAGDLDVAEVSVSAGAGQLSDYAEAIDDLGIGVSARLVKRVTESESTVLGKLQTLVFLVTAVVLLLTMICVATTMTAVVTERRREIGLRKALGASDQGIMAEFMGEGLLLGAGGGLLGTFLGFAFAQYVSIHVFSASITFMAWLLPVTILSSVLVTGLACLPPVRATTNVDPALVLKGE